MFTKVFAEFSGRREADAQGYEGNDALALNFIWTADDRGFGDGLVGDQGALILGVPRR